MNFQSVLIITYGRSGSTLLQGLLNSIEGCIVRGENYNMFYGLFLAYRALQDTKMQPSNKREYSLSVTHPWFGAAWLDEQRFLQDARELVFHQLMPENAGTFPQCIGFKEIRYLSFNNNELSAYLNFLSKLFPNPAFIFLTRDHGQVLQSAWWKNEEEVKAKRSLEQFEATISTYVKGKNFVFSLDYQDMTNRTPRLKQLFDFLGAPYIEEKIDQVLATKHSYVPPDSAKSQDLQVDLTKEEMPTALMDFFLDPLNNLISENESIILSGVAVLRPDSEGKYSLLVVTKDRKYPVTWELPSPVVGEKYPFPHAGFSRFKSEAVSIYNGEIAELFLLDENGQRERLAKLSVN